MLANGLHIGSVGQGNMIDREIHAHRDTCQANAQIAHAQEVVEGTFHAVDHEID